MCLARLATWTVAGCLGALVLANTAHGQSFGELADSTAEGVILKARAERLEAAHKLALGGRKSTERAADVPVAAPKFVSKPGVFMAPTTPPPPPPPPANASIAPVQALPVQSEPALPLPPGAAGGAQ